MENPIAASVRPQPILQHHPMLDTSFVAWQTSFQMGGRHHFRIPWGPGSQKSRRLGRSMACALWDQIPNGASKNIQHMMGNMSKNMTRVSLATKLLLTLQLRSLHSEKCIHVFIDMCIEYMCYIDIQIWTCTVSMVHACACPIYTYLYSYPNHFILMKCLRILICQKKMFLCISKCIYIISNMSASQTIRSRSTGTRHSSGSTLLGRISPGPIG